MSFWKTEDGKIMSTLVHDHTNKLLWIEVALKMHAEGTYNDEEIIKKLPEMLTSLKEARDTVDYAYTRFKERYENSLKNE